MSRCPCPSLPISTRRRLSCASVRHLPLNTLVTTGTGSGKTWFARPSGNGALALHHVLVIEAGPLHESLTPLRRWESSCAAPSVAHPLTAPQAHLHTQR